MSELTRPPLYTSWRNLPRGEALAKHGDFSDLHLTNAEAIDMLQRNLQDSLRREAELQEERVTPSELALLRYNVATCSDLAARRLAWAHDLERKNARLFRWSCLGYLLALGLLTFIFATGSN
jgi:hypothetical protein